MSTDNGVSAMKHNEDRFTDGEKMEFLKCNIGYWRVEAKMRDVDHGKRLAMFSAKANHAGGAAQSRHTVVFDHVDGCDHEEEAKAIFKRVLDRTHG